MKKSKYQQDFKNTDKVHFFPIQIYIITVVSTLKIYFKV